MKAAVYEGPGRITVQEVPHPQCGPGEILLKVDACAICGTDVRIYKHGHRAVSPPHTTGHEIAATVHELGAGVERLSVGDRVAVVTEVGCGRCEYCLQGLVNHCEERNAIGYYYPGGFAEYMKVPAQAVRLGNLIEAPVDVPAHHVALVEPLACVLNGQQFLDIGVGETVAVIGAGPIGCMHLVLAQSQGASRTILINHSSEERARLAGRFHPDVVVISSIEDPVARVLAETKGRGADVVIVACSAPEAQEQAVAMAAPRGRISLFGGLPGSDPRISFDSNRVHYKEISVHGAFSAYHHLYKKALEFIAAGIIPAEKFVTHRFPLDKIKEAIETASAGEALKVVVEPGQTEFIGGRSR